MMMCVETFSCTTKGSWINVPDGITVTVISLTLCWAGPCRRRKLGGVTEGRSCPNAASVNSHAAVRRNRSGKLAHAKHSILFYSKICDQKTGLSASFYCELTTKCLFI